MTRRDLARLKTLQDAEPAKLSKLIGILWPDIRAAISHGHTLKFISNRLQEVGIPISYHQLVVYVGRLRRTDAIEPFETARGPERTGQILKPSEKTVFNECEGATRDPLANIKDRLIHNRPGFNFDDRPPDKKKLIG